ncbi:hypothetical protein AGMMS49959_13160 [Planctomycetales bacterium]|nr:hypothetical protein AGMMS49959_13160 [Planctomycetales bacterium]
MAAQGLPARFCIFLDDAERAGEQETVAEVMRILRERQTAFLQRDYDGEKRHTLIFSPDLKFLQSLR